MDAIKCDRCGKYFDNPGRDKVKLICFGTGDSTYPGRFRAWKDVCDNCYNYLKDVAWNKKDSDSK